MRRRWLGRIALIIALITALAGCVSVPTEGPVEKVEGQQPACQNCVNVEVAPPAPGDDPLQIVEGYLRATSNYQAGYSIAKQYLTRGATEKWSPDSGVTIYSGSPVVKGQSVELQGRLVGSLAADRTYKSGDRKLSYDFGLVQENGEWRINTPPPGLMVAVFVFRSFYRAYQLYFVSNDSVLVPDTIYLPTLPNPANVASALMKALLNGPSSWLDLVADSAIPPETTLAVESVTITDGIAAVALSDPVLALPDARRSLLAAQIVYTLKQAVGVKGVLIRVNQEGYRVPESDETTMAVGVEDVPPELEPVPLATGDPLYAVTRDNEVQLINSAGANPERQPLAGALAGGGYDVDSIAVSPANTDMAVVTNGRTRLRRGPTTGEVEPFETRFTDLLRPQFTRYGEVWAIGRVKGRQQIWVFTRAGRYAVDAPLLAKGGEITAFKISPDGTRMALVRKTATGSELGLTRVIRADRITVDGWRPIDLTQEGTAQVAQISDVAWLDASELLLIGAPSKDATQVPVRVTDDASRITAGGGPQSDWDAQQVTVLMRTQAAVVVGAGGQTWRDDGSQWQPFLDNIRAVAYPG
ncbi:MAG TPA: LpqB family beta-propeller domain-containing protein [Propionibacteriaceae bacterium]|nr:LpqB family beta-propeller domain-containing protein [Propionibacteriaceae bacterium]